MKQKSFGNLRKERLLDLVIRKLLLFVSIIFVGSGEEDCLRGGQGDEGVGVQNVVCFFKKFG